MSLVSVRIIGSVHVIQLNDPKRRNILSRRMCEQLSAAVKVAETDEEAKAVIVTGAAPAFCAGADLHDLEAASAGVVENLQLVYQSFMDVANCSLPTIAAVNGAAVGAGMNLALACDIRLASEHALFDTRFLKIGLHPGGGNGWLLLRAVSWAEATRMLLLGHALNGKEALANGLIQQLAPLDGILDAAIELAGGTDALPRELIIATKASLRLAARSNHAETFENEAEQQLLSLQRPPFQELVARLKTKLGGR